MSRMMAFALLFGATALVSCGSGALSGGGSVSASVEVSYDLDIAGKLGDVPEKYKTWAVSAEGYAELVSFTKEKFHANIKAGLAAAVDLPASASIDAIVEKFRNAVDVEVNCSLEASFDVSLSAEASGSAAGSAGNGGASGGAEGQARAQAAASGSVSMTCERSENMDPTFVENWDDIQIALAELRRVNVVIVSLGSRGQELNTEGKALIEDVPADVADNPLRAGEIVALLRQGSDATLSGHGELLDIRADVDSLISATAEVFTTSDAA